MKISFLIFSLQNGGAERMICRLAGGLAEKGENVSILVFDKRSLSYEIPPKVQVIDLRKTDAGVSGSRETDLDVSDLHVRQPGISGLHFSVWEKAVEFVIKPLRNIRRHITENQPDVMFCFTVIMIPYAVLANAGLRRRCKVIGAERTNPRVVKKLYRAVVRLFLHGCDGFVFQTEGAKACYPKWLQKRGTVIGNIAPRCRKREWTAKDGMERSIAECADMEHAVCSVGRLHKAKDFDTLLRAFQLVARQDGQAALYIYGDGPLKEDLQNLACRLGIAGRVFFMGFSRNMMAEFDRYEIFAFSSRAEGMPNALLEAMSAGLACVSSDCEFGPSELITGGVNGYLVPPGDFQAMAQRLAMLLQNQELRREMGRRAQAVSERFSEKKIAGAFLKYAKHIAQRDGAWKFSKKKKLRIGFFIYSMGDGGSERTVAALSREFYKQGHSVSVCVLEGGKPAYQLASGISVHTCRISGKEKRLGRFWKRSRMLAEYVREDGIQILVVASISMVPYALAAAAGNPCRVIGCERANPYRLSRLHRLAVRFLSPLCDGYLFQTEGAKAFYPLRTQKKSAVIANMAPEYQKERIHPKEISICSAGRLHPDKDFVTLLKAFRIFQKKYPQSTLTIYGDGMLKQELVRLSEKLGIKTKVLFQGFVENILDEFSRHMMFVFSSKSEGMPNALIEAMSTGLPCISADCCFGPGELIQNGVNGWLVPVGDAQKMAERMEWVVEHPVEAEQMGRAARRIQETNAAGVIVGRYLEYMDWVIGK